MKNPLLYYIGSIIFSIALTTFYAVRLPDILADARLLRLLQLFVKNVFHHFRHIKT